MIEQFDCGMLNRGDVFEFLMVTREQFLQSRCNFKNYILNHLGTNQCPTCSILFNLLDIYLKH